MLEAQVMSTSPIAGQIIRDVRLPEGAIVAAIQKSDKVLRPTGDTRIEEGNVVVIFSLARNMEEVERLLQVQIDFF